MSNSSIKISKENLSKFNHDKNVVGITQEELVSCPFNDQADLCTDAVFDNLFDNGEYIEHKDPLGSAHWVVGFIGEIPVTCYYWYDMNYLVIKHDEILYGYRLEEFEKLLVNRTTDEQTFPKLKRTQDTKNHKVWELRFYYKPEYAAEFLG